MAAIQLSFSLRTSVKCKTVHLLGSWDGYDGQLPLSKDPAKSGGWRGTFRFSGATLQQGQRYWYYYIIDGYHISHDPARDSQVEPTTGRTLNILNIPHASRGSSSAQAAAQNLQTRRGSALPSIATGRSLSPSQIRSPYPSKPYETQNVRSAQFASTDVQRLAEYYAKHSVSDVESLSSVASDSSSEDYSDGSSDVPSRSSRSTNNSSPSSVSSRSSTCNCERYAITRAGNRVKLDCGGSRCGYSEQSSDCASESDSEKRRKAAAAVSSKHSSSSKRRGYYSRR